MNFIRTSWTFSSCLLIVAVVFFLSTKKDKKRFPKQRDAFSPGALSLASLMLSSSDRYVHYWRFLVIMTMKNTLRTSRRVVWSCYEVSYATVLRCEPTESSWWLVGSSGVFALFDNIKTHWLLLCIDDQHSAVLRKWSMIAMGWRMSAKGQGECWWTWTVCVDERSRTSSFLCNRHCHKCLEWLFVVRKEQAESKKDVAGRLDGGWWDIFAGESFLFPWILNASTACSLCSICSSMSLSVFVLLNIHRMDQVAVDRRMHAWSDNRMPSMFADGMRTFCFLFWKVCHQLKIYYRWWIGVKLIWSCSLNRSLNLIENMSFVSNESGTWLWMVWYSHWRPAAMICRERWCIYSPVCVETPLSEFESRVILGESWLVVAGTDEHFFFMYIFLVFIICSLIQLYSSLTDHCRTDVDRCCAVILSLAILPASMLKITAGSWCFAPNQRCFD